MFRSFSLLLITLVYCCTWWAICESAAASDSLSADYPDTGNYNGETSLWRRFAHHSISHTRDIGSRFLSTGLSAGNAVAARISPYRRATTTVPAARRYASASHAPASSSMSNPKPAIARLPPALAQPGLPPPSLPPPGPTFGSTRPSFAYTPDSINSNNHRYTNTSLLRSTCDCRSAGPPAPVAAVHSTPYFLPNPTTSMASTTASFADAEATTISITTKPPLSDDAINTRIVNGTHAEPNAYPYLVSLGRAINNRYSNQSHYCGGVLINSRWVLTAAHCISDYKPKKLLLAMGSSDRNRMRVIVEAWQTAVHPNYSGWPEYANDIALIQLKQDVRFSQHVRPGCLHLQKLQFNGVLTGLGWGQIAYSGNYPNDLQKVTFNYVPNPTCRESWSKESSHPPVTARHICVHNPFSDICGGDSGSPLVYHSDGRDYIVGVASFTNYCDKSQPAVYMRIYPYAAWILSVIRDYCV